MPNVNGKILAKVIEYCRYHVEAARKGADDKPAKSEDEVKAWDTEFVKVDQATLFDLILVGGEGVPGLPGLFRGLRGNCDAGGLQLWPERVVAQHARSRDTTLRALPALKLY